MAEAGQFLEREGTVIHVQELRTMGKDPKWSKQVGGFTIETSREYKDKTYHDYITFDCEGKVMVQYPNVGDVVTVGFTIGGNKWTNKEGKLMFFNKLKAFKVETKSAAPKQSYSGTKKEDVAFLDANQPEEDSGLPF
jgi:hypothetical protein